MKYEIATYDNAKFTNITLCPTKGDIFFGNLKLQLCFIFSILWYMFKKY